MYQAASSLQRRRGVGVEVHLLAQRDDGLHINRAQRPPEVERALDAVDGGSLGREAGRVYLSARKRLSPQRRQPTVGNARRHYGMSERWVASILAAVDFSSWGAWVGCVFAGRGKVATRDLVVHTLVEATRRVKASMHSFKVKCLTWQFARWLR